MQKRALIWVVIGVIFLATAGFVLSQQSKNQYEKIPYTHSYTKAFCNSTNICQDFEIFCKGNEVAWINFTGATTQFKDSWEDPRNEELKLKTC